MYRRSDTGGGGRTERTARNRSDKGTFQYGGDEAEIQQIESVYGYQAVVFDAGACRACKGTYRDNRSSRYTVLSGNGQNKRVQKTDRYRCNKDSCIYKRNGDEPYCNDIRYACICGGGRLCFPVVVI